MRVTVLGLWRQERVAKSGSGTVHFGANIGRRRLLAALVLKNQLQVS